MIRFTDEREYNGQCRKGLNMFHRIIDETLDWKKIKNIRFNNERLKKK